MRFCLALFLISSSFAFGLEEPQRGTCVEPSQVIFLQPPEGFSPRREVAGCYCEQGGKVLYLLRSKGQPQELTWCVPGGKLEKGETPTQAIVREIKEEIDVTISEEKLTYCRPVYVRFPEKDFILHLFRFEFEEPPALHLDLEENSDYRWVPYEEVFELSLIPGGKECFCEALRDKLIVK